MKYLGLVALLCMCALVAQGQEKTPSLQELEEKRKRHEKELFETQRLLNSSKKNETESLSKLQGISRQLLKHRQIVEDIQMELGVLESRIGELDLEIKRKEQLRKQYEQEYQKVLQHRQQGSLSLAYKELMSYFSANNITDLMTKENIWRDYNKERSKQIQELKQAIYMHNRSIAEHQEALKHKNSLVQEEQKQINEVAKLEEEQKAVVAKLRTKTANIEKQLQEQRNLLKELNKLATTVQSNTAQVNKNREISTQFALQEASNTPQNVAAQKPMLVEPIRRDKATTETPNANAETTTKVEKASSEILVTKPFKSFQEAKGFLQSPVKGYISTPFGKQAHPLTPRVLIENLGVDIRTAQNAQIKNVFAGVVSVVHRVNGSGWVVVVQHGDFYTVYAKVKESLVEAGQKVKQGEGIGIVSENMDGYPEMQFQIWHKDQKLNPEEWIQF
jgi:septal ring factor EnvC (AmiA/AmiB activator)